MELGLGLELELVDRPEGELELRMEAELELALALELDTEVESDAELGASLQAFAVSASSGVLSVKPHCSLLNAPSFTSVRVYELFVS